MSTATQQPTQTQQPTWLSWAGGWAQEGACWTAGTVVGWIVQEVGRGWAVRIGSNYIHEQVYSEAMKVAATAVPETVKAYAPAFIANAWTAVGLTAQAATASVAANASVGVAVPYLSVFGSVAGGAVGFLVSYYTTLAAIKVGSFVVDGVFSLVAPAKSTTSKIQAHVATRTEGEAEEPGAATLKMQQRALKKLDALLKELDALAKQQSAAAAAQAAEGETEEPGAVTAQLGQLVALLKKLVALMKQQPAATAAQAAEGEAEEPGAAMSGSVSKGETLITEQQRVLKELGELLKNPALQKLITALHQKS